MQKFGFLTLLLSAFTALSLAQNPVQWDVTSQEKEGVLTITYHATISDGYHCYDLTPLDDGPEPTTFTYEILEGATPVGDPVCTEGELIRHYEDAFEMEVAYYENQVTFQQQFNLAGGDYAVEGYVRAMACNDQMCTPPQGPDFAFHGSAAESGKLKAESAVSPEIQNNNNNINNAEGNSATHTWYYILVAGFIAGLLAVVTPCVWPMIPMTMSFFLKRSKDRRKSIREACTYGLSIIVIYVALGLAVSAIFGASALNSLATNAVFNIIFFLLLVVFAVSFFGAFEIALPSSWTTRLDEKADDLAFSAKGKSTFVGSLMGLLSIFFMAFTLVLVSFSCTGPIIGTLLVEAATSGSMLYPAIGMFGFALALSLPFTLFALFPQMLKSMPKSGGWLNRVKVVLGFLELALSLKFLSVADLAYGWGLLDREVFLCLWIIIFLFLGLYLLGFIRLPHDDDPLPSDRVSVSRMLMALCSLAFALYMVPGLWGAPCKAISAFAPPMYTQDFNLFDEGVEAAYYDFDAAQEAAKRSGKPMLVDFSGFGCVNCRKMEAAVWTAPAVKEIIERDYILVSLMVDDKTPLPGGTQIVEEADGSTTKLRTLGDKWSYLQRSQYGANAQPYYVLLSPEGVSLNGSYSYDEDVDKFVRFLKGGLK